MVLTTENKDTE